MKEWPILFRADMVRAILAGRKAQTRRLGDRWAKAKPGDLLWVKETWARGATGKIFYRASAPSEYAAHWKSPLFMSRDDSRIALRLMAVRREKLKAITDADVRAEGCPAAVAHPRDWYAALWDEINGDDVATAWHKNPLVWALTFKAAQ